MAFNLDELLGPFEGHKKIVDELERWKKAQTYGEEELRKWQLRSEIAKKEQPKPTLKPQVPETTLADKLKQVGKVAIQALEGFGTALRPFEAEAYYAQYPERRPAAPTTTAEKIARTGGEIAATALPLALGGAGAVSALARAPQAARTAVQTVAKTYRVLPRPVQIAGAIGAGATAEEVVRGAIAPKAKEQTLPAKLGASLRAGFGDVLSLTGSVAEMLKQENAVERLRRAGEAVRTGFEAEPVEFNWKSFFDPDWYAVNVARAVPLTVSLIPAMYLGYKTGGKLGAKIGLGPFGRAILSSVVGAAASRPLEAAFEAAGTYEDYLAQNPGDVEGAERAARQTFIRNLPLGALDLAELATAFAPVQIKPLSRIGETLFQAAGPNLARVLRASARALGAAPQEALEEAWQEKIQRQALGEPVTLDAKMAEAMAIGGLFGAGMGGVGSIVEHIQRKTLEKLSPELRDEVITKAKDNVQTLPPEQAIEQALDDVMASDEKKKAEVESAVEKTVDDLDKTIKRATASRARKAKTARVEVAKTEAAPAVAPVEPATAPPAVQPTREPWQMTLAEFQAERPPVTGYLYHGSPEGELTFVDVTSHTQMWPEGLGFYATESREAAEMYAKGKTAKGERKGKIGAVNYVIGTPQKVLDMDAPADRVFWRQIADTFRDVFERYGHTVSEYEQALPPNAKNKDAYQELVSALNELMTTTEGQYMVENALRDAGIDATTHLEGVKSGRPHRVVIFKNPEVVRVIPPQQLHKELVKQALAEGKPIPEEVLADYPELRPATEAAPTAAPTAELAPAERAAVKPETPEAPETAHRKVSPKAGGTYTARIVKKFRNLEEGQEITGRVNRIIKYKSGLVVARVETADGQTIDVPVSKYAEWYPAEAVAPAIEAPPTEEIAGAEAPKSAKIEAEEIGKIPAGRIADFVFEKLRKGETFTSVELFKVADEAYGGTQAEGKYTPKDAYDAMELGVNKYIYETFKGYRLPDDIGKVEAQLELIKKNILDKIPTQTKRTAEQEEFQQFSTPPNLAYVAAWTANITPNDVVLEPSAGIGGLAVFAKAAGAETVVNELSLRRAALLRQLGFDRVFTENAEQLHNVLPRDVRPTVVIMNPPFSATAGRMEGKRATKNAILHIEQALKRLEPGGRLVAIVGRGMADNAPTFRDWWKEIKKEYNVRANVGIDGKNYVKYGTGFDVQLVVIDKTGPTPEGGTITGNITDLKDIFPLLEGIRNERVVQPVPGVKPAEQAPGEPVREGATEESRGGPTAGRPVPAPTGGMGVEEGGRVGGTGVSPVVPTGRGEAELGRPGRPEAERLSGDRGEVVRPEAPPEAHGPAPEEWPERLPGRRAVGRPEGAGEEEVAGRGGAIPGGEPAGGIGVGRAEGRAEGLKVETTEAPRAEEELTDAVYTPYQPQKLKIPDAKPHPGFLAQSAAMAAVEPPAPTYTPKLPKEIVKEGKLSIAQLEAVVYAGQAHQQVLPSGERRGFFIGDGTGVGKGREISGIIMDNWNQGRKKAVWVSVNMPLMKDAQRDFGDIGGDPNLIFDLHKIKLGTPIKQQEGILFTTYRTLAEGLEASGERMKAKEGKKTRIDQIIDWLGQDFDGVIVFDEAHKMGNSIALKGKRGAQPPAAQALAGIELQKRLPNARVVYASATGASEVRHLAFAERLGLWGEGTPFASKIDFIEKVASGGLAAMELVARDMKAVGVYLARNLDYTGVTYGTLEHQLTEEQKEIYDTLARAWQIVLQNIEKALEVTNASSQAKVSARSRFWAAQQRFFNQILISMQMPSVVEQVKKDLEQGHAVVMQLVNTNEAVQNRQLAKAESEEELEDLDLTPRDVLMQYLDKSFPTQQYEEYIDEDGNIRKRPVYDSMGRPVHNQEALEAKERLMNMLGALKVPDGPLEIILRTFGAENVAEVTGRTRRVVWMEDESGRIKPKVETRTSKHAEADATAFMDDKKRFLIFSDAGGTGRSYHADRTKKNQRKRIHYLIQPGWRADNAIQGLGRTHRTNEASAPHYILVTTNLKGHKRFISTIARRLDQLGALTKGQRQAGSQGLFGEKDNLENVHAKDALQKFYEDLANNQIEGLDPEDTLNRMGLRDALLDDRGNLKQNFEVLRDITRFLNRILVLETDLQNKVFDEFAKRFEAMIVAAIANGTLDVGLENYRADKIKVIDEKTVYTEEKSGAETKYIELEASHKVIPTTFKEVERLERLIGFYRNTRSGKVYAVREAGQRTRETGRVVKYYRLYDQVGSHTISEDDFKRGNYEELDRQEARELWEEELKKVSEYRTERIHLISGTLLPIWDRLPEGHVRVYRLKTDDGRVLLGRLIPTRAIDAVLRRLGAERTRPQYTPAEIVDKILNENYEVYLANDWKIVRRRVSGEYRIEIIGADLWRHTDQLQKEGVFTERIDFQTRYFIPTGEKAAEVLANVTKYRPIVDVISPAITETKTPEDVYSLAEKKRQTKKVVSVDLQSEEPSKLSPKATREITERLTRALNTAARSTRMGRKFAGMRAAYEKGPHAIRTRRAYFDQWRTVGHEIGHAFFFKANFKPDPNEMVKVVQTVYPGGQAAPKTEIPEGFAEFFMLWFADNARARELAPKTAKKLEALLNANPELQEIFDQTMAIAEEDLLGTPLERMRHLTVHRGMRVETDTGEYRIPWWKRPTFWFADGSIPLQDLYKEAASKGYDGLDPAKLYAIWGMAAEEARQIFMGKPRFKWGGFVLPGKRSLQEIVEEAAKTPNGVVLFDWIYRALRDQERASKGFVTPYPKEVYDEAIKQAETEYPHLVELVKEYAETLSEINLRLLVAGEVISKETADRIRKGSKYYFPTYFPRRGRPQPVSQEPLRSSGPGVARFRGHTGQTLDFLEATLLRLHDTVQAVEINRLMQAIEESLKKPDMGRFGIFVERPVLVKRFKAGTILNQLERQIEADFFEEMNPDDETRVIKLFMPGLESDLKKSEPIIVARHGDKSVYMQLAPDLFEAVQSLRPIQYDWLTRVLTLLTQVGRVGALANIRYLTNVFVREVVGSGLQSKTTFERSMAKGYIKGALVAAGFDGENAEALFDLYIQSGAYGSAVQEVLNSMRRSVTTDGLLSTPAPGWKRTAKNAFVRIVNAPLDVLRITEEAPRIAEFEAVLKKELAKHGLTLENMFKGNIPENLMEATEKALVEAAYASREVVVNFGLQGTNAGWRKYTRTVAFLHGSVQGIYRAYRQVKSDPTGTMVRWLVYVLPLTLLAWALSHDDDKYKDMPSEARDTYWWFPVGKATFIALAKPYEYALPANLLERFLDWLADSDDPKRRKPLEDLTVAVKKSFSVNPTSMVVNTIWDLARNKNFFGSPIVPEREMQVSPEYRYGPETKKASVKLAQIAAWFMGEKAPSPRQIDYFMKGVFGGAGETFLDILSFPLKGPGAEKRAGIEYMPILGPLVYGPAEGGSRIVDRFYKDYDKAQKLYNDYRLHNRKLTNYEARLVAAIPAMRAIADDLAELRRELREIEMDPDLAPERKRQARLRYNWISRMAAGFLYGAPVPEAPPETGITEAHVQDYLRYYDNLVATAIERAMKRKGGPI